MTTKLTGVNPWRAWPLEHKTKKQIFAHKWYLANRERLDAKAAEYRKLPHRRAKRNEQLKALRKTVGYKLKDYGEKYYLKHQERCKEYARQYRLKNNEKILQQKREMWKIAGPQIIRRKKYLKRIRNERSPAHVETSLQSNMHQDQPQG